jgi:hypothetical protein
VDMVMNLLIPYNAAKYSGFSASIPLHVLVMAYLQLLSAPQVA